MVLSGFTQILYGIYKTPSSNKTYDIHRRPSHASCGDVEDEHFENFIKELEHLVREVPSFICDLQLDVTHSSFRSSGPTSEENGETIEEYK